MGNTRRIHLASAVAATFLVAAPAKATPYAVEALFPPSPVANVTVSLASICIEQGWAIATQTDNQVVCEREPDPMSSLKYLANKPRRGASALRGFLRFTVLPLAEKVRVQVSGYSEYSTAFGQSRKIPLEWFHDIKPLIEAAGGTITQGSAQ